MKKLFLIFAVAGVFCLTSCGGGSFNPEKAKELIEKCESSDVEYSDVEKLLKQYEAALIEIEKLESKVRKGEASDSEKEKYYVAVHGMREMEYVLRSGRINRKFDGVSEKVFEIYKKHQNEA